MSIAVKITVKGLREAIEALRHAAECLEAIEIEASADEGDVARVAEAAVEKRIMIPADELTALIDRTAEQARRFVAGPR